MHDKMENPDSNPRRKKNRISVNVPAHLRLVIDEYAAENDLPVATVYSMLIKASMEEVLDYSEEDAHAYWRKHSLQAINTSEYTNYCWFGMRGSF